MENEINILYAKYSKEVYYYLYSLVNDKEAAEDLTSETFISAITSIYRFEGKSDIKTWVFGIARHKYYEFIRKQNKQRIIDDMLCIEITETDISAESNAEKKALNDRINSLIALENDRAQKIIMLRAHGYSFSEISCEVNISESSARVIEFRTRKKIKNILKSEGYLYE